jgi:hypothetical protein
MGVLPVIFAAARARRPCHYEAATVAAFKEQGRARFGCGCADRDATDGGDDTFYSNPNRCPTTLEVPPTELQSF